MKIQILIKTDIKGTVSGKVVQRRSCRSITIGNCIYKSESPNLQFLCTAIQVIFFYIVFSHIVTGTYSLHFLKSQCNTIQYYYIVREYGLCFLVQWQYPPLGLQHANFERQDSGMA